MIPEKVGISAWVFLMSEAKKWDRDPTLTADQLLDRLIKWPLVYPCPTCQGHYYELVMKHFDRLQDAAKEKKTYEWFVWAREEIARTDKNAHGGAVKWNKNVDRLTYHYIAAILFSYEPRVNLEYCRRVRVFLLEWRPQAFQNANWADYEALWDILDDLYPRQKSRRQQLVTYFQT